MQPKSEVILKLFSEMRGTMFEAMWGLYMKNIKEGKRPEDCPYVLVAERNFYNSEEYEKFKNIIKEISCELGL